jgi:branched-subunit amino acid ABC-type transport system permease component
MLEGGRRYSPYSFLTLALDEGEWSVSYPSCALPQQKGLAVLIGLEAGWASKLFWMQRLQTRRKILCPCWGSTLIVQSIVRHYTD